MSMRHASSRRTSRARSARRGSVYLFVLATTTLIATLLVGTLYAQSQRLKSERLGSDTAKARIAAASGIEVVRAWIAQDASWRANHTSGRWASNLVLGDAKVDLDVVDTDGNLSNHPYHSVQVTATARVGSGAEQIVTATLDARPQPIDALAYAMHAGGQLHVKSPAVLQIGTATASSNGEFKNETTVEGNILGRSINNKGTVFGTMTTSSTSRAMPASSQIDQLISMGTTISATSLSGVTLSPTANPYGAPNAYGIYILNSTSDVNVTNLTMNGTLIVLCPGKKTNITGSLTITPSSRDFPALVIRGDLVFNASSGQVNGIVHATGAVELHQDTTPIIGTVLAESTASSDAIQVNDNRVITYDPTVYAWPPVGYAKQVDMVLQAGSYRRLVK